MYIVRKGGVMTVSGSRFRSVRCYRSHTSPLLSERRATARTATENMTAVQQGAVDEALHVSVGLFCVVK